MTGTRTAFFGPYSIVFLVLGIICAWRKGGAKENADTVGLSKPIDPQYLLSLILACLLPLFFFVLRSRALLLLADLALLSIHVALFRFLSFTFLVVHAIYT